MSNHTLGIILVFAIVVNVALLLADDEQPKPVWTNAYILRTIIAFAMLPVWITLLARVI